MEKRMLAALGISLLILLLFQTVFKKSVPAVQMQEQLPSQVQQINTSGAQGATATIPFSSAVQTQLPQNEEVTEINTERFRLLFSDIGGALKEISIFGFSGADNKEELLMQQEDLGARPFALQSALYAGLDSIKYQTFKGEGFLEYNFIEPEWLAVTKRYTFHKNTDYIELSVSIKNLSSRTINFSYQITGASGMEQIGKVSGRSFLEANALIDGKIWKAKSVKAREERGGNISWIALKNRYFALILMPYNKVANAVFSPAAAKKIVTALNSKPYTLAPNETASDKYIFYAGPLIEKRLVAIEPSLGEVVDFGFFGIVSKKLLLILRFIHKFARNWGVAIILLTMLINLILFPLTKKSFVSMQKMKKVQPHMQKLKEVHKDNPQKLNKEMMELYKTYKINPLGGCLPMVLQMPIFIALYQGLIRSIELKGATFLWVQDLAKPDAIPLPFSLPVIGNHINLLPLLMVGIMVLQQKISQNSAEPATGEQASQQKMMMIMFPLFFGFLFYNMPSGLVLYWLTNTILMTLEQGYIGKRITLD